MHVPLNIINQNKSFVSGDHFFIEKPKIYLHQFNQAYDETVYIPISIAFLKSSCMANKFIVNNYEFGPMIFYRDYVDNIIKKYIQNDISAFSLYVWNEKISLSLAKAIKEKFGSVIIFGGPSVENESEDMLRKYPFIDYLVHGEGEKTFVELLTALKQNSNLLDIQGISFIKNTKYYNTGSRERIKDLNDLPSPFLDGTLDELFLNSQYKFQSIWETNRGCPFACTFCYWGSNLKAKVSTFDMDRLTKELQWMSQKNIEFIYAADANFGILQRDVDIAEMIVNTKKNTGYPQSFFVNFAKNSGDRVFDIAKKLYDADLSKGTTLSLQSLDDQVLEYVKRRNIKMSVFKDLQRRYRIAGIPSYTEIILPLPGETLATYIDGLEQCIAAGEHDQVYVYLCRLLPNTEMSSKESREKFSMATKMIPILSSHVNLGQESVGEREYEEILIQTNTMTVDECKQAIAISWMIITHVCLKTAYFPALYLFFAKDIKFTEYLIFIMNYIKNNRDKCPLMQKEHKRFDNYVSSLVDESGDGEIDYSDLPMLPKIRWPIEETSFIVYSMNREVFYEELKFITIEFLKSKNCDYNDDIINELFTYQKNRLIGQVIGDSYGEYNWDWSKFFINCIANEKSELEKRSYKSFFSEQYTYASLEEFVKYHVWFGRRRKHFYYLERAEYI